MGVRARLWHQWCEWNSTTWCSNHVARFYIGWQISELSPLWICILYHVFGIFTNVIQICNKFQRQGLAGQSENTQEQHFTRNRKVARMCTIVVAIFVLAWTPFQVDLLYFAYGSNKDLSIDLMDSLFVVACMNSCVNPIIYGFMWKPMKDAVRKVALYLLYNLSNSQSDMIKLVRIVVWKKNINW